MKLKSPAIETLLQILVAEGEVSRAALKVLTTWPGQDRFAPHFRVEVDALLAQVDHSNPKEHQLGVLMSAARDRLLGLTPAALGIQTH